MTWEMIVVSPSGEEATMYLEREPTIKEFQFHVGGYVERLPSKKDVEVYGDEDGRFKKLPVNSKMSERLGYVVVGPIVEVRRKK